MRTARWLVFDISVYIAAIQGGVFSRAFRRLEEKLPRTYLASVVAGKLLGEIRRQEPHLHSKISPLWNDLLIALSARQVGATVVTHDVQDLQLLRRHVRFDLHIPS